MRRRLFTFATVLSLVMCAATVALWVWSCWHLNGVDLFPNPQRWWSIESVEGRVCVQHARASNPFWVGRHTEFWAGDLATLIYSNGPFQWRFAGFAYGANPIPSRTPGVTITARVYQVPHAFVATVFAVLPALYLRAALKRRTRRARLAAGLCPGCGYDLRASTDRCLECGTPAADANAVT